MRAALVLFATSLVVVQASVCAAGIHRGPSTRDSTSTSAPHPVGISPGDRVRIETVWDPARVPEALRGKFAGSVAGMNHENLTVVLADGQPAVVHRDLIKQFDVASQHGPRWKHVLIGAGIGAAFGAMVGATSSPDAWLDQGDLIVIGSILWTPIGAMVGAVLPAGTTWKEVPLERVEWSPDP